MKQNTLSISIWDKWQCCCSNQVKEGNAKMPRFGKRMRIMFANIYVGSGEI